MADRFDPYAILQVSQDADQDVLQAAYRALARRLHPDHSDDPTAGAQMAQLNAAWETLGDPERRAAYDRTHLAGVILDSTGADERGNGPPGAHRDRGSSTRGPEAGHVRRVARRRPPRPGDGVPTARAEPARRPATRRAPCSTSAGTSAGRSARSRGSIRATSSGSTSSRRALGSTTRSTGSCALAGCGWTRSHRARPAAAPAGSGCPAASARPGRLRGRSLARPSVYSRP